MKCLSCQKELELPDKLSFREECLHCGADLHCCLCCDFYDQSAYNECRENSADRVLDKDRNNYCEYFQLKKNNSESETLSEADLAKQKLKELFGD